MSSRQQDPADEVDTESVSGLGEIIPEPLMPIWTRIERIQTFRETHGPRYTKALEAIVAVLLVAGYGYWLYLYFIIG